MKIECDELLVICDNCGHAIHVKELNNNLIKLNNKNDKLISEQTAIDALIEWYGCEPNDMDYFKEILAKKSPAQPERDIPMKPNETIDSSWGIRKKQAVCPKCDYYLGHVEFIENPNGKKVTYCETCGQAIDWEGWEWEE